MIHKSSAFKYMSAKKGWTLAGRRAEDAGTVDFSAVVISSPVSHGNLHSARIS